jgi:hypothetical protein
MQPCSSLPCHVAQAEARAVGVPRTEDLGGRLDASHGMQQCPQQPPPRHRLSQFLASNLRPGRGSRPTGGAAADSRRLVSAKTWLHYAGDVWRTEGAAGFLRGLRVRQPGRGAPPATCSPNGCPEEIFSHGALACLEIASNDCVVGFCPETFLLLLLLQRNAWWSWDTS